jgi:transcriptional regulator with XRE-family HTH domain
MDKHELPIDAFFETNHPDLTGLGARLRTLRRQARLTQAALASRAGLHRGTIADLERGRRTNIWFSTARRLATALGLDSPQPLLCESPAGFERVGSIDRPGTVMTAPYPLHPMHNLKASHESL